MPKLSKIGAAIAAISAVAVPMQAGAVAITQSINLSQLLSGSSTSVEFNIGSLLASNGYSVGDVVSGNVMVYGLSDAQFGVTSPQAYSGYTDTGYSGHTGVGYYSYYYVAGYYSYSCGSWGWSTCYAPYYGTAYAPYYFGVTDYQATRYRDVLHQDSVADTMLVTAGSTSASDTADTVVNSVGAYGAQNYESTNYSCGQNCSWTYYYNRERDIYEAIDGPLMTALALDPTALGDINADGILDIGVTALIGQFKLTGATLNLEVETHVPEPGTLGLAAVAAAAAVLARRRRNKK